MNSQVETPFVGTPRPFLKWAGGKSQLLGELRRRIALCGSFGRYYEPFLGGGALFFALAECRKRSKSAFLADSNPDLINVYAVVRDEVDALLEQLRRHKAAHDRDYYYAVRASCPDDPVEAAARIIYLNRTCFNGLFRKNRQGQFNVPMGRYANPRIVDEDNLRRCSVALRHAHIRQADFSDAVTDAKRGDLVYFDPPYHPLSPSSSFTSYDTKGFDETDQSRLARVACALRERGVHVLLSNSDTPFIHALYADFTIERVYATRSLNSRVSARGRISEVLIRGF